jgi:5'-methylthioadenosine phosphorylase
VFAQFEKNMALFKNLVGTAIGRVAVDRTCTHCVPHTGVILPLQLP